MAEYKIDPPLRLAGRPHVYIHTVDEAADFVRNYKGARRPLSQDNILRRLEGADTIEQQTEAATAFRGWAEAERLLIT
jgi:hypothetical protein